MVIGMQRIKELRSYKKMKAVKKDDTQGGA